MSKGFAAGLEGMSLAGEGSEPTPEVRHRAKIQPLEPPSQPRRRSDKCSGIHFVRASADDFSLDDSVHVTEGLTRRIRRVFAILVAKT